MTIESQETCGSAVVCSDLLAGGVSSRPLKKEHRHETKPCPRCGLHPLLYRAGSWKADLGWTTGRMWYECPGCGKRGGKSESHEGAANLWNSKVEPANDEAKRPDAENLNRK